MLVFSDCCIYSDAAVAGKMVSEMILVRGRTRVGCGRVLQCNSHYSVGFDFLRRWYNNDVTVFFIVSYFTLLYF